MCCKLERDLLVGGQIANEHGNVEIVLGPIADLPAAFAPALRVPHPWQLLLVGRKFRGLEASRRTADVSLKVERYKLRIASVEKNASVVSSN